MTALTNMPEVKLGIVGVSRDCFPISLTSRRLDSLMQEILHAKISAVRCGVIIESEKDALAALDDLKAQGANAAVVFLGNFGPEGPATIFAERFGKPVMFCAAAEEDKKALASDRGDALCGMLNISYNLKLRKIPAYIPPYPVGLPHELAARIDEFVPIARVLLGLKQLKVLSFGPRPQDFLACNAPIAPLYDLGIQVMENSELDLLQHFQSCKGAQKEIAAIAADMERELGGCCYKDLLPKLAQYEHALMTFYDANLGASEYAVFANKCWPSFESAFGFVPCYVNSRLAARGIPVACEVDIYGAVSEYMVQCASGKPATLLDINNSVPADILPKNASALNGVDPADLVMGFHCGNTASCCMKSCEMKYQLIMNRLIEGGKTPDITRGTLEGQLRPGDATLFRLQSSPSCELSSYIAEGEILDIDPCSFGSIGVFGIKEFRRFYRHVLIEKGYPHHGAIGFAKLKQTLYACTKYLGVTDINTPLPADVRYQTEI